MIESFLETGGISLDDATIRTAAGRQPAAVTGYEGVVTVSGRRARAAGSVTTLYCSGIAGGCVAVAGTGRWHARCARPSRICASSASPTRRTPAACTIRPSTRSGSGSPSTTRLTHTAAILERLDAGAWWICGSELEARRLARAAGGHGGLLSPSTDALSRFDAAADLARRLGLRCPPAISPREEDWRLSAFGRAHGWRLWLTGPDRAPTRIDGWRTLERTRAHLAAAWSLRRPGAAGAGRGCPRVDRVRRLARRHARGVAHARGARARARRGVGRACRRSRRDAPRRRGRARTRALPPVHGRAAASSSSSGPPTACPGSSRGARTSRRGFTAPRWRARTCRRRWSARPPAAITRRAARRATQVRPRRRRDPGAARPRRAGARRDREHGRARRRLPRRHARPGRDRRGRTAPARGRGAPGRAHWRRSSPDCRRPGTRRTPTPSTRARAGSASRTPCATLPRGGGSSSPTASRPTPTSPCCAPPGRTASWPRRSRPGRCSARRTPATRVRRSSSTDPASAGRRRRRRGPGVRGVRRQPRRAGRARAAGRIRRALRALPRAARATTVRRVAVRHPAGRRRHRPAGS